RVARRQDRFPARAAAVRIAGVEVAAELGGDDEAVAARLVPPYVVADDLLGVAPGVEVRGVDEVAAELEVAIDDLLGLLHARAPAEVFAERHRAEAKRAHAQAGAPEGHVVVERHDLLLVVVPLSDG